MLTDVGSVTELEVLVVDTIARVQDGHAVEDDLIELKRELIDPAAAARRLAGQANRANGDPVLWIIGVDETTGTADLSGVDVERWLPQVISEFDDGVHPVLRHHVQVVVDRDASVTALLFDTEEAPYVVRLRNAGVDREVPIRSATATRSARRHEILAMVTKAIRTPSARVVWAEVDLWSEGETPGYVIMRVELRMLINPRSRGDVFLLAEGMKVAAEARDPDDSLRFRDTTSKPNLSDPHPQGSDQARTNRLEIIEDGAYVSGTCTVQIEAGFHVPESIPFEDVNQIDVAIEIPVLDAQPIRVSVSVEGPELGIRPPVRLHWGYP